jgi:hypothetical protein
MIRGRNEPDSKHHAQGLAGAATLLAIVVCYGTLMLIATLSLIGITLVVHEGAWAVVISALAVLAVAGVLMGYWHHRTLAPLVLALAARRSSSG